MSIETRPMLSGLLEAAEALEQGQLEAAAALLGNLVRMCTDSSTGPSRVSRPAPAPLPQSELLLVKQLFERCQAAAAQRQVELAASLSQSAVIRRASHAYGPRNR